MYKLRLYAYCLLWAVALLALPAGAQQQFCAGLACPSSHNAAYWGAGAMEVDGVNCSAPSPVALVANGPTPLTIACTDNDASTISGSAVMPVYWNAGTVTFTLALGQIAADTDDFAMHFEGQCIGHDEAFLAFAGTGEQLVTITATADDDALIGITPAVTLNGTTCAAGDVFAWQGAVHAAGTDMVNPEANVVIVGVRVDFN